MLRAGRMDEFVTEEEEPWYDQRDLEQGEPRCVCVWGGGFTQERPVRSPHVVTGVSHNCRSLSAPFASREDENLPHSGETVDLKATDHLTMPRGPNPACGHQSHPPRPH